MMTDVTSPGLSEILFLNKRVEPNRPKAKKKKNKKKKNKKKM